MIIFSYKSAIRIFFLGFLILFVGIGFNKGLGLIDLGVVITFMGFGILYCWNGHLSSYLYQENI